MRSGCQRNSYQTLELSFNHRPVAVGSFSFSVEGRLTRDEEGVVAPDHPCQRVHGFACLCEQVPVFIGETEFVAELGQKDGVPSLEFDQVKVCRGRGSGGVHVLQFWSRVEQGGIQCYHQQQVLVLTFTFGFRICSLLLEYLGMRYL